MIHTAEAINSIDHSEEHLFGKAVTSNLMQNTFLQKVHVSIVVSEKDVGITFPLSIGVYATSLDSYPRKNSYTLGAKIYYNTTGRELSQKY